MRTPVRRLCLRRRKGREDDGLEDGQGAALQPEYQATSRRRPVSTSKTNP
jgi:hypothetical protein